VSTTNEITEVSTPAAAIDADKTRVSSAREAGQTFIAEPFNSASHSSTTQYTHFNSSSHTSSGFAEAQAIVQHTHAGNGSGALLKKRFLLEDVLGQGGMGTVYRTKDLRKVEAEDPNPYIATKVLSDAFKQHPNAFVTLQQETAKSHALAHPNIVTVHDFDRDGDILFMTMELLQGDPLDRLLRQRRNQGMPKGKALAIVRDLCSALAYAHQRHIIHADFKPGNVFICADGTAKVLDFGIARAASKETQKHTFDAGQLGAFTPAYATMEMVRDEPLTFADDVYALACVVYEILSGQHPYQNKSALEAKQLGLKLKPIATLNHREWKALGHALSLEQRQRTPTVAQFMAEMFPRRRTWVSSAAILMAVIALGGAAWFAYSQHQTNMRLQNTIAENMAQAQTCFAQSDFACALEHSLVVESLDATNKAAIQLAKAAQLAQQKQAQAQKITQLLADADACMAEQDDTCAQIKAKEVLALDANNLRAQQLIVAANDLDRNQNVSENIQQAEACLQNKDTACAHMFAKKAAEINANHPAVKAFMVKLEAVEQQGKLMALAQQQKVNNLVQQAQDCLSFKKYDCAIKHAEDALVLDPVNGMAMEVKQTAAVADKQIRDAQEKVSKILAQAKDCLDKQKNYSCAIAKAEAALDVMPNNAEAQAIKARAQDTQRKIKETGFNIK